MSRSVVENCSVSQHKTNCARLNPCFADIWLKPFSHCFRPLTCAHVVESTAVPTVKTVNVEFAAFHLMPVSTIYENFFILVSLCARRGKVSLNEAMRIATVRVLKSHFTLFSHEKKKKKTSSDTDVCVNLRPVLYINSVSSY